MPDGYSSAAVRRPDHDAKRLILADAEAQIRTLAVREFTRRLEGTDCLQPSICEHMFRHNLKPSRK